MKNPRSLEQLGHTEKIPVAVLGATGTVGQRFLALLADHPWFEVKAVCASERSAGKRYRDAATWIQNRPIPEQFADLVVIEAERASLGEDATVAACPLVFSALDAGPATAIEAAFAERGHLVVSNARSHRMAADVPLMVPEVNPDHLALAFERAERTGGAIITNPNCSTIGLVLTLAPLHRAFGVEKLQVVTLQAISGAGLPGVSSYEISDNVIPLISGEEEKLEIEPHKILGKLEGGAITPAAIPVSAQCNRVPVVDGHTLCVSLSLERKARQEEIEEAWRSFTSEVQELRLPSAPEHPIHLLEGASHPQPRLHRDLDGGMAASVGRLRPCPLLDYRYVTLSHNTVRGAAGGALLAAELAVAKGLLEKIGAKS